MKMVPRRKKLSIVAMAASTLLACAQASAWSFGMDFKGYMTLALPDGTLVRNISFSNEPNFNGWRSPVDGKMIMKMGLD